MDLFQHVEGNNSNYEQRIVKDLCKRLGLPDAPRNADFEWFAGEPTGFPARLACGRFPYVHAITFQELVGSKFVKMPFMTELETLRDEVAGEMGSVVVFPWTHLGVEGCDMMCVHDLTISLPARGWRFSRKMRNNVVVTLQTLRSLVEDLKP